MNIEPASRATSASEQEQGDHGAAFSYTKPGTVTDPANPLGDPPTSDMSPEVLEALATRMHAIPAANTQRNCVVVGIGGPSGVGKSTLAWHVAGYLQLSFYELHESCAWLPPAERLQIHSSF